MRTPTPDIGVLLVVLFVHRCSVCSIPTRFVMHLVRSNTYLQAIRNLVRHSILLILRNILNLG